MNLEAPNEQPARFPRSEPKASGEGEVAEGDRLQLWLSCAAVQAAVPLRRSAAALALALAALALACAQQPKSDGRTGAITGTITYRERIALPEAARVEVQLVDATDPDESEPLVAERLIDRPGQVPIPFSLAYDPRTIASSRTYALRVRIRVGDDVWFASPVDVRVLTGGSPSQLEMQLERVSADGGAMPHVAARNVDPDPPNLDPRAKAAREEARAIDARLDRLDMREVTEGIGRTGFEPRRLQLWVREDEPVKLTVRDAVPAGRPVAPASYYFRDGALFWVRAPDGGYLFDGDALVLRLDGHLAPTPNAKPEDATRVKNEVRASLATFGLE
jgi:uncharacterized lipoprotein YbaY